jgi:mannitol/fructose-specific phosphotransferase system IIA component (Ntr-type)
MDIAEPMEMEDFFNDVSAVLAKDIDIPAADISRKFVEREQQSTTVIRKGLAIPHIILQGKHDAVKITLVRAQAGIIFPGDEVAHTLFVLVGSSAGRAVHLKILAAIAQVTQKPEFDRQWAEASDTEELKNIVLLADRKKTV